MSWARRHEVAVTTSSGGAATGYTAVADGEVLQIDYVPHGTAPLDTGADIVVTDEATGRAIVTKANIGTSAFSLAPRQAVHAVADGAGLLYAAGGAAVTDRIAVARSRIKIVVAQGGDTKSGTFHVLVG